MKLNQSVDFTSPRAQGGLANLQVNQVSLRNSIVSPRPTVMKDQLPKLTYSVQKGANVPVNALASPTKSIGGDSFNNSPRQEPSPLMRHRAALSTDMGV